MGQSYVATVRLVVDGGTVGVAACNFDGSEFTAAEIFAKGAIEVHIALDRVEETHSIVVRTVSGEDVRVTVSQIGIFTAGQEVLEPRHHGLGYDLFVVLSPAKTGTFTIEGALYALAPSVCVRRLHHASAEYCKTLWASFADAATRLGEGHAITKNRKLMAEAGDHVRFEIGAARRLGGRVAFFTAVRDPISRAVASLFHALPTTMPEYSENYARGGSAFAQMLADGLVTAWRGELEGDKSALDSPVWPRCLDGADYLDGEFRVVTGFDLLRHEFDPHKGYARIDQGNDTVLVFRTTALDRMLPTALAEITGCHPKAIGSENVAEHKQYVGLYNDVLSRLRLPHSVVRVIYERHAYVSHFFTPAEIDALVQRWSAPPTG